MSQLARRLAASMGSRATVGAAMLPALPTVAPIMGFATEAPTSSSKRSKFFRAEEHAINVADETLRIPQRTRHFRLREATFPTKENGFTAVPAYRYAHVHHEVQAMLDVTGPLTRTEIINRMVETGYTRTFVKNSVRMLYATKRIRYRVLLHPRTKVPSFFFYTTTQSQAKHAKLIQKESYLRNYRPAAILEKVAAERAHVETVLTAAKERAVARQRLIAELQAAREAEAQALRNA